MPVLSNAFEINCPKSSDVIYGRSPNNKYSGNHTYAILKHIGHFCHVPLYSGNPISREWSMFMCTIYCSQRYRFMFSGAGEKIPGKKVYS